MLRIRLIAAVLSVTVLLCACSAPSKDPQEVHEETVQQLQSGYTATLEIRSGEVEATARFDQSAPGTMSIEFLSPKSVEGLVVETQDEWVKLTYKGISGRFTMDQLFDSSVAKQIVRVLSAVLTPNGLKFSLDKEQFVVEGPAASGTFYLRIARDTKNLLSISIPEQKLEIKFSDFMFGTAPAEREP